VVAEPSAAALIGALNYEIASEEATPHSFADVNVAIVCGRVAVAENGAVGIAPKDAPHRALLYLAQRLVVLLPADAVVPQMHSATVEARASCEPGPCFTWMAGPSKTADIERNLVVGAHGPRALCVIGFHGSHD
jgi:L-lactate dehydrogenase complex protein LldG